MNQFIKNAAFSLGFDACGVARAEFLEEDAAFLQKWLDEKHQGEMQYLERNFNKRTNPKILVPGCKSVAVVLLNYFPTQKQDFLVPQIAKYAYSTVDYHLVIKQKLKQLENAVAESFGAEVFSQEHQHLFVDSAPVLERRWAERAGLGWIGKHTQLINPQFGSYVFIGILMLNVEMEYDEPLPNRCGKCTRCIDACPTNALKTGILDACKCISYLTIENKNEIPREFQHKMSNYALGCDICADICPWNKKLSKPHHNKDLEAFNELLTWKTEDWMNISQAQFNAVFKQSSVQRAGFKKLKSNLNFLHQTNLD